MADIEGIARRIYDIIISPETVTGLINGGLSVPLDYGYLIYGIFDTGSRHERETERSLRVYDSLSNDAPEVYALIRSRNYGLLYFLFADAVQPFVDAIHAGYTEGQPVFNRIMKRVDQYMNKNAKAE
ncbi:hypothetical protein OA46_16215 [Enterobacter cloacae]|nr:hypothetical protein OA46_16215 [Enterobacter cloacae]